MTMCNDVVSDQGEQCSDEHHDDEHHDDEHPEACPNEEECPNEECLDEPIIVVDCGYPPAVNNDDEPPELFWPVVPDNYILLPGYPDAGPPAICYDWYNDHPTAVWLCGMMDSGTVDPTNESWNYIYHIFCQIHNYNKVESNQWLYDFQFQTMYLYCTRRRMEEQMVLLH